MMMLFINRLVIYFMQQIYQVAQSSRAQASKFKSKKLQQIQTDKMQQSHIENIQMETNLQKTQQKDALLEKQQKHMQKLPDCQTYSLQTKNCREKEKGSTNSIQSKSRLQQQIIQQKLAMQIEAGKLQIEHVKYDYSLNKKQKAEGKLILGRKKQIISDQRMEATLQQKLKQTQQRRQNALEILKKLQKESFQLKKSAVELKRKKEWSRTQNIRTKSQLAGSEQPDQKRHTARNNESRLYIHHQRSYFSPDQKITIRAILRKSRLNEQQQRQKTSQVIKHLQQASVQQSQAYQSYLQKQKLKRRSMAEESLKRLSLQKQQKEKFINQTNKAYQSVKLKRYLFHDKTQEQLQEHEQKQAEIKQKLKEIKARMRMVSAEQIKEHQEKYDDMMSKSRHTSRFSATGQLNNSALSPSLLNPCFKKAVPNHFNRLVRQQIQQQKIEVQLASQRPQMYQSKIQHFKEHIQKDIMPNIRITQQSAFIPEKRIQSVNSLSYTAQREKGNNYLAIAKKMKKQQANRTQKLEKGLSDGNTFFIKNTLTECQNEQDELDKSHSTKKASNLSFKHKNYLQEMRMASQGKGTRTLVSARKKFNKLLEKQCSQNGSITEYSSLNKAMNIVSNIEATSKRSDDQKMIESAENKIKLLKKIMV